MASIIEISQPTALSHNQVRTAVDNVFKDLSSKYTLTGEWRSDRLFIINGQWITVRLEILESSVEVTISLSGMLSSFSKMIESQVRENLRIHLAP